MVPGCQKYKSRWINYLFIVIDESFLSKLSLAMTLIGITALFLISIKIEPEKSEIGDITANLIGHKISVEGFITDFYWHDGHFFATLSENRDEIKLVVFERDAKKFPALKNVTKGSHIIASGSVNEYKGEIEIVVKDVRVPD